MNFDYFNYKSNDKVKKGSIIFSQPLMNDKNFKRSIILICEHDRDGSFGYKLNDKVDCEYLEINVDKKIKNNLYYGGPVDNTFLNFVHNDNDLGGDKLKIKKNIFLGGDYDEIKLKMYRKEIKCKFFMGYSGWSKDQLEDEIKENSWIVINNFDLDKIFEIVDEKSWSKILSEDSFRNKIFSNYPSDSTLN